jgi:beta-galactosidase/beta-glucuronidase
MTHPVTNICGLLLSIFALGGGLAAHGAPALPAPDRTREVSNATTPSIPYPDALAAAKVSVSRLSDLSRDGLVVGNGELNAIVYAVGQDVHVRIGKNDCWDLRVHTEDDPPMPTIDPATGAIKNAHATAGSWNKPYPTALPCAELILKAANHGDIRSGSLDLANATATVTSANGQMVDIRVLYQDNVLVLQSDRAVSFVGITDFLKEKGINTWVSKADQGTHGDFQYLHQNLPGDQDVEGLDVYVVAGKRGTTQAIAVVTSRDSKNPLQSAADLVGKTLRSTAAISEHEARWRTFWATSGVKLGDAELQQWWYRMLYFFRTFSRSNGNPIGLAACFDRLAGWHNSLKINYNIQQTYLAAAPTGHPDLIEPFIDHFTRMLPRGRWFAQSSFIGSEGAFFFSDTYPFEPDPANCRTKNKHQQAYLPWGCTWGMAGHIVTAIWEYYAFNPSETRLARIYPLIKEIGLFYCSVLEKCQLIDGKRKIGPSYFPELGRFEQYNVSYDIHFITMALRIARDAATISKDADFAQRVSRNLDQLPTYSTIPDPLQNNQTIIQHWQGSSQNQDRDRHGTLVQGIFPASLINWFSPDDLKELGKRTINYVEKSTNHANSNVTINVARARLGLGEEAIANAKMCFSAPPVGKHSQAMPNGLFAWSGHGFYMTEQVAIARLVTELLLQSTEGIIRFFPAWPSNTDAQFTDLLAQGGFAVSADKMGGAVTKVVISSLAGNTVRFVNPWPGPLIYAVEENSKAKISITTSGGISSFPTSAGKRYVLILPVIASGLLMAADPAPVEPSAAPLPRLSPQSTTVPGCAQVSVNLDGTWQFHPAPPVGFAKTSPSSDWRDIQVPGEWVMQGFTVKPGTAAGYRRTFQVPSDWMGKRIKLRCDAVYSNATVWINGNEVGRHEGGFTPFEIDVTNYVQRASDNIIAISALNESIADRLANGSGYACHQLGGIPRSMRLFVAPNINIASFQAITRFDEHYRDATLDLTVEAAADGGASNALVQAQVSLTAPDGKPVRLQKNEVKLNNLRGNLLIPVANAVQWDPEHPRLYTLTIALNTAGKVSQTITRKIGFRQIEVRGTEVFVNGRSIKLRGVNRHEVTPLGGRSVSGAQTRRDVELFRDANVNHIRTCHYPPNEELMNAADELGMFIECEAPICFAYTNKEQDKEDPANRGLINQQTAEMVLTFRNHPSVLMWSIANESEWCETFAQSSKLIRRLDPTRPLLFNDWNSKSDPAYTEIYCLHYAHHGGPRKARQLDNKQPVYLGEDCHVNSYNHQELATDPALRDQWGKYLHKLWDDIYKTKGCIGQSVWAGIDDTFYLPNGHTVGYGAWGPLDGWRRPKPEYWQMKRAYSPIRIVETTPLPVTDKVQIRIENRQIFSDLSEMRFMWRIGGNSGKVAANGAPGSIGTLIIPIDKKPAPGIPLELICTDSRGCEVDQFRLALGSATAPDPVIQPTVAIKSSETPDSISVQQGNSTWRIARTTGQLSLNGVLSGPALMVLPLNEKWETKMFGVAKIWAPFTDPCSSWVCTSVAVTQSSTSTSVVTASGSFKEATGNFVYTFAPDNTVTVSYDFTMKEDVNPRQIGLVFTLPRTYERLSWTRDGNMANYPIDHIARLQGTVTASEGFEATSVGPRTQPGHPWRLDRLPYGNNDFCSTKHQVITASITNAAGTGIQINGHGRQHVRCWQTPDAVQVLVADYSNGGGGAFTRRITQVDEKPLKAGARISGAVSLRLVKNIGK